MIDLLRWPKQFVVGALIAALLMPCAAVAQEEGAFEAPTRRQIENAVNHGLRWLVENQITEGPKAGAWPSVDFQRAGASFAGLALLANGYRPGEGEYGEVIDRALDYVMAGQDARGWVGEQYEAGMYMHTICTLFAISSLGRHGDPAREREVAEWARKSLDLILEAQQVPKPSHAQGGWRYTPGARESDLSVTACVLQVLQAARQAGYEIPDPVFQRALQYMNKAFVQPEEGMLGFIYRPGVSIHAELPVTGIALYVKHLLEREPDKRGRLSLEVLRSNPPVWSGRPYMGYFFLGTFYISQGMFQVGGEAWEEFSPRMAAILIERQQEDGDWPLPPDNAEQTRAIGPVYPTSMAVLMLSLDRQYLPIYQRQEQLF